jgi:hypothetical protein
LRACLYPLALVLLVSLPLFQYVFMSRDTLLHAGLGFVMIGVTAIECVAVGTYMGLLGRNTSSCVLAGYAGCVVAIGFPVLANMAIAFFSGMYGRTDIFVGLWYLSPITAYAYLVPPESAMEPASIYGWFLCTYAHLAFSFVVLRASVALFARRHMRDS